VDGVADAVYIFAMSHERLQRLDRIFSANPIFFITTCTADRKRILDADRTFQILREELVGAEERHGWRVGRFVVMPDHLHWFCAPAREDHRELSIFVGQFKQWTSKRIAKSLGLAPPIWQENFFDHLLRSDEAYQEKADYMWLNPVRAGLVHRIDEWPYKDDLHPL
jgi:REP element-mobilizing transposase RayT